MASALCGRWWKTTFKWRQSVFFSTNANYVIQWVVGEKFEVGARVLTILLPLSMSWVEVVSVEASFSAIRIIIIIIITTISRRRTTTKKSPCSWTLPSRDGEEYYALPLLLILHQWMIPRVSSLADCYSVTLQMKSSRMRSDLTVVPEWFFHYFFQHHHQRFTVHELMTNCVELNCRAF